MIFIVFEVLIVFKIFIGFFVFLNGDLRFLMGVVEFKGVYGLLKLFWIFIGIYRFL